MNWRKMISCSLICEMIATSATFHTVYASATKDSNEVSVEEQQQDKEQKMKHVLKTVKQRVKIPGSFDDFSYSYDERGEESGWFFSWSQTGGPGAIWVSTDPEGNILHFEQSMKQDERVTPAYKKSELESEANKFMRRIMPLTYKNTKLREVCYDGWWSNTYRYIYDRIEYGVPVSDNSVEVVINAATKEVERFSSDWEYNVAFDEPDQVITQKEARELMQKKLKRNLQYHLGYQEDGNGYIGSLVYVPSQTYLAIDAKSKEYYDAVGLSNNLKYTNARAIGMEEAKADGAVNYDTYLTDEELEKIKNYSKFTSKEDAINILKKNKGISYDATLSEVTGYLTERVLDDSKKDEKTYVWNLNASCDRVYEDTTCFYYPYYTAEIDAKTGKIYSYSTANKCYNDDVNIEGKIQYTDNQGKNLAIKFLKENCNDWYSKCRFLEVQEGYVLGKQDGQIVYGGKMYCFTRYENGIEVPDNTTSVAVDLTSGKIYSYHFNWNENITFEDPKDVMSGEKALKQYLDQGRIDKAYEFVSDPKVEGKIEKSRLIYCTKNCPPMLNAHSGKPIYEYMTVSDGIMQNEYCDLDNYPYRESIELLHNMEIGFKDKELKPDQKITGEEWNMLIEQAQRGNFDEMKLKNTSCVKRKDLAIIAIRTLGYEEIAKCEIFKSLYADCDQQAGRDYGALVLAEQFGLLHVNEKNELRPEADITRGEACELLFQLLKRVK